MSDRIRVAIIGQGRSGRDIHGAFFRSPANTKFQVVAVADLIEGRRARAREEYGCEVYADYREFFNRKDIDLVVNSTFSHEHYPVTMDLLRHGLNVVVEKPFSAHRAECEEMIRTAKENGVMLCVFQQSHFAPYYRRIREIMDSGVLGRIIQISIRFSSFGRRWDWQCVQRFYGGSLRNTGPHPLEQALDILDMDTLPTVVSKLDRVNTLGDAEDYCKVLLMAPGKPLIDLEISSCDAFSDCLYHIQGSQGTLKAGMNHLKMRYFKPEEAPPQHLILESLEKPDGTPSYCREELKWIDTEEDISGTSFDSAVKCYYDTIWNHLREGKELVIKPEKLLTQIDLFEEVHRQNPLSQWA